MFIKSILFFTTLLMLLSSHAFADHANPMGTSEFSDRSDSGATYNLQIASNPIQTMQAQQATFIVTDSNGAPVSGIAISCSMKMPSMAMAKNTPPIKETDQAGVYESILLFTMGGDWAANCTATNDQQVSESFTFEINDVPHDDMAGGKHDVNKMLGEKNMQNMKQ